MRFRAADIVHHTPSGERWKLACDESPNGDVLPTGWPETLARANDCTIIKDASDAERESMLVRVADGGCDGYRGALARRQLDRLWAPSIDRMMAL